jgi:hypothetical protein
MPIDYWMVEWLLSFIFQTRLQEPLGFCLRAEFWRGGLTKSILWYIFEILKKLKEQHDKWLYNTSTTLNNSFLKTFYSVLNFKEKSFPTPSPSKPNSQTNAQSSRIQTKIWPIFPRCIALLYYFPPHGLSKEWFISTSYETWDRWKPVYELF